MQEESLKKQTVRGVGWSFIDSISGQGITFLVGLVLARLLSPEEYGLIGIVTIFITVFNAIIDSGFSTALIRKNDANDKDYNTMFVVNLGVSLLLFALFYLSAPVISFFFQREELTSLCRVMGFVIVINSLSIVQITMLTKNLDFKTKTKASFISSLLSGVIGIILAYNDFGVWALVAQQISRQTINTICLWMFNRWLPNFRFSIESFNGMWGFGWKMMTSNIIYQAWTQIYQVVIGKFYSPATLGLYTRAYQFANICSMNLTTIVQRVSFPAFSKLIDDKEHLKKAYKKTIKVSMLITFTLMMGLAGCAKSVIIVLIGEKWVECIPILQIICFSMMFYPLHALNLNMLQVQGRSDLFLKLEIAKKFVDVVPLLVGIFYGIHLMLICGVFTGLVCYYLNARYSGRLIDYSIAEQIYDFLPSLLMALSMFVLLFSLSYIPINHFFLLLIQICSGAVFTWTVCEIRKPEEYIEVKKIALPFIVKLVNRK